jgi:hypothetical protein
MDSGSVDYISWSMLLSPKDLPQATVVSQDSSPSTTTLTERELELIDKVYARSLMLAEEASHMGHG